MGTNFTVFDVSGRRGQYAGQALVPYSNLDGFWAGAWALEGDHEVFPDDDEILGTGMEDYFGGAWYYLRGPFAVPLSASSGLTAAPISVAQVRHLLLGTIPFERRFRFQYETFVEGTRFDSCAIWYEDTRDTPTPTCPGG